MEKKIVRIMLAASAACLALSCAQMQVEEPAAEAVQTENVFFATVEGQDADTKIVLASNGTTVNFEVDDMVQMINSQGGDGYGTVTSVSGTRAMIQTATLSGNPVFAVYPSGAFWYESPNTCSVMADSNQDGEFRNANIMVAKVDGQTLNFKNVFGMIALNIADTTVTHIVVEAPGIAGYSTVTFSSPSSITVQPNISSSDRVDVYPTQFNQQCYIAVRPGTYPAGSLVLKYFNPLGQMVASVIYPKALTIERNKIYKFGNIIDHNNEGARGIAAVSPSAGRPGNTCSWVQLWENGPKFAEFNLGATISSYGSLTSGTDPVTGNVALYNTANVGGLYAAHNPARNSRVTSGVLNVGTADVATAIWGDAWREPSDAEMIQLMDFATAPGTGSALALVFTWCDGSSVKYCDGCTLAGLKISGKKGSPYENNSIFLPAAGNNAGSQVSLAGTAGRYLGSTSLPNTRFATNLNFASNTFKIVNTVVQALSVRPVLNEYPTCALPGEFSVSTSKKVRFSSGNLKATMDNSSYHFSIGDTQYLYVGGKAGNTTINSQQDQSVVDLFGWSTAATNYGISTSTSTSTYSGDFKDWGTAIDSKNTWRTLSSAEWTYLLKTRKASTINGKANCRFAEVMVDGITGLMIFPDVFTWPSNITSIPATMNASQSSWNSVNYNPSQFSLLQAAGVVFLPTAGYRSGSSYTGSFGRYWACNKSPGTNPDTVSMFLYFFAANVITDSMSERQNAYAVRLATDVN